jgi:CDP-glucose 4,6-dehydratase
MVERILRLMDSDLVPDVRGEASNEIRHQYLSAAKARRLLGWTPRYGLDEALRETIAWYRDYFGMPSISRRAFSPRSASKLAG